MLVDVGGGVGAPGGDVGKAHESMHEASWRGRSSLRPRNAYPVGQQRWFGESPESTAVQESFQDVLLDIEIVVDDGRHLLAELRKILHGLFDAVVGDVVGGWLGAQVQVIAHVLLDESAAIVTADDGIGQIEIFDHGLQLTPILPGQPSTKDGGDLVGLANGAIRIQRRSPIASKAARRWKIRLSQYST